ncbi:hypothetical protein ACLOJK_036560 [Asimina triloba]
MGPDCLSKMLMMLHFFLLIVWLKLSTSAAEAAEATSLALPHCQESCGNISIPYPFGIGVGCYRNQSQGFEIICANRSSTHSRPFIRSTPALEIIEALYEQVHVRAPVAYHCYNKSGFSISNGSFSFSLHETPFSLSATRNKLFVIGCNTLGAIQGYERNKTKYLLGSACAPVCYSLDDVENGTCNLLGCCSTGIPEHLQSLNSTIETAFYDTESYSYIFSFNPCGYAFIGDRDQYQFSKTDLSFDKNFANKIRDHVPMVLDWVVGNETCEEARRKPNTFACHANSDCSDSNDGRGYLCNCLPGFQGNPYLPQGCEDIDECKDPKANSCTENCTNSFGSYHCSCPEGTYGDGQRDGKGCIKKGTIFPVIKIILGVGLGIVILLVGGPWLYWGLKQRRHMKLREEFFKKNGGLILQEHISLQQGSTETHKIFTAKELEKATDNYNKDRIIGKGGYGTVYRGTLANNMVVAIKKAKIVDKSQVEQFINEVKILSQINHRNVVKLVGSCLETEVPLLVYEYVSNGTLFHHIHDDDHQVSLLSWDNRLRIASEVSLALAYLHSEASIPIIHRDVKSSNILLDDNYTAKVSDFGASRLILMDKAELTTLVQGTLGYLDPEYLLTSQLTEKSDVYSFGVVLAEL